MCEPALTETAVVSYRRGNMNRVFHYRSGCFEGNSHSIAKNTAPYITHQASRERAGGNKSNRQRKKKRGNAYCFN